MMTFTDLYDKIYNTDSSTDPKRFVQIVESSNLDLLAVLDKIELEDKLKVTRFVSDYAISLASIEYTIKTLTFLNKAIELFQDDETFRGKDLLNEPLYESLIWKRAKTYYVLDNYWRASIDFKQLKKKFSSNDLFQKGYDASLDKILSLYQWISLSVLAVSIISILFLELELGLKYIILGVLVVSLIVSVSLNYMQKKIRMSKNK